MLKNLNNTLTNIRHEYRVIMMESRCCNYPEIRSIVTSEWSMGILVCVYISMPTQLMLWLTLLPQ